ncbi:hypothetical protein JOC77_000824 [Peribacillus deserti]|uniref:YtzI protein n=1 Tax=Peribacillus deserti TaxID=673318 RepID=A0ABS2QE55_9BACI|nr:hypothetical protein [Peribacillus deserti]MBM7691419.1 hypothetical protein [Peribacillus deserti]
MANLWLATLGILFVLGMAGGAFFFLLKASLDTKDAVKIDSPKNTKNRNKSN